MSSLLWCQISVGATIILPWNIVGGYSTGASVGDLKTSICNGSVGTGWELPAKYKDFSFKASIGRSKTDSFDNVMLSVSVSEVVALFGRYLSFNLVEQSDNNNNSTLNVNDQSPSMQSKRSAFEVLMTSSRKTSLPEPYAEDTSIPNNKRLVSSPEPKAQVSYCHSAPSSVRPSSSVCKLSHFQLLLQNRLIDFDETW